MINKKNLKNEQIAPPAPIFELAVTFFYYSPLPEHFIDHTLQRNGSWKKSV